jgi:hypothetical protein
LGVPDFLELIDCHGFHERAVAGLVKLDFQAPAIAMDENNRSRPTFRQSVPVISLSQCDDVVFAHLTLADLI